ncbi:hypothetical protein [Streptomyces noursei]|uniref:hypothetical protein n=1 Tax=Streptomyces noursei TaxID=1971 RepID=UPI00081C5074|nr:hypothetical protein [Streptomyces noursei]ANZ13865.1 membrane protein [Streptomyces noursei ATCC 11455]MCZ1013050.1 hypothetical protein [Streptomyces noursei]GGX45722.1 hypothetical protein GCM10010341_79370 [Streptomyces noursei]
MGKGNDELRLSRWARIALSAASGLAVAGLVALTAWWTGWHLAVGWVIAKLGVKAAVAAPVGLAAVAVWLRKRRSGGAAASA